MVEEQEAVAGRQKQAIFRESDTRHTPCNLRSTPSFMLR